MIGEARLCDFCTPSWPQLARVACVVCSRDFCSEHGDKRLLLLTSHKGNDANPIVVTAPQNDMHKVVRLRVELDICRTCMAVFDDSGLPGRLDTVATKTIKTLGAAAADALVRAMRTHLSVTALSAPER